MRWFSCYTASALALVQPLLVAGLTLSSPEAQLRHIRRSANAQIQQELASVISSNSTIFGPWNATFGNETERYMQNITPHIQFSVLPALEDDVSKIVTFLNNHNVSFYAVSRGHALTTSVGLFDGVEIDMRYLNHVSINPGNTTVHLQGGVYSEETTDILWSQGYLTATGTCSCVSTLGPGLGGGHGLQQGKHGLTMDHFVSMNVVLANGTAVVVNETSNTDLWYAMRGAGHNFGIVTSWDAKIWPDNFRTYFVRTYQFAGSELEAVVEQANSFQDSQLTGNDTDPACMGAFGLYTIDPSISTTNATIYWIFIFDAPASSASATLQPFDALSPLTVTDANVTYNVINNQLGGGVNDSLCQPNFTHVVGTANLRSLNVTTMRAIYELYNEKIALHPELGGTRVLHEGYAMQGVQARPSNGSAYPFRADNILTYFDTRFNTSSDPLVDFAVEWRNQTVDLWNAGKGPGEAATAYVNYAAGYETVEERYGVEPWRLEKLRGLKAKYDPLNKFAWYNPIIPPEEGRN